MLCYKLLVHHVTDVHFGVICQHKPVSHPGLLSARRARSNWPKSVFPIHKSGFAHFLPIKPTVRQRTCKRCSNKGLWRGPASQTDTGKSTDLETKDKRSGEAQAAGENPGSSNPKQSRQIRLNGLIVISEAANPL